MNFEYQLLDNQLYLAPITDEVDFHFLGLGFRQGNLFNKQPIKEIIKTLDNNFGLKLLEVEASRYPNSSSFAELRKLDPRFVFQITDEFIFFGGSFNPWHRGHSACLELMGTKPIIVLPDRNPFKEIIKVSPVEIYLNLSEKLNLHYHYLNPEFILKEEKNPTYTWIKRTRETFPEATLSLLMGMDSLDSIHTWYESDKLLKTINVIYVASRNEDIAKRVELHHRLNSQYPALRLVFLGHHQFEDESSTKIRAQNKKGP